jgi:hypothetical protein
MLFQSGCSLPASLAQISSTRVVHVAGSYPMAVKCHRGRRYFPSTGGWIVSAKDRHQGMIAFAR